MAGSLHIFRREVANGLPCFQVNYNLAGRSFARVFEGDHQLNEFLEVTASLPGEVIEEAWKQLDSAGSANIVDVDIAESQAISNNMKSAPTDF
ncbi:MAG: hypothetical protein ROO76_10850 [Terriglobia bacterium]|jgi:hypothetical protein|nr:hypothetical protein [Terriglobia bacterium]